MIMVHIMFYPEWPPFKKVLADLRKEWASQLKCFM